MRIVVSYHTWDTYDISDEKWREVLTLCDNDVDAAFNLLIEEGCSDYDTEVTDRIIEVMGG